MNWPAVGLYIFEHLKLFLTGIGVTGGGMAFIKLMKHWPAPKKKNGKLGAIFDTIQDVISNNERIGQRSDADSAFVTETKAAGTSATAHEVSEPKEEVPNGKKAG